ncbi:undecaprenyl/decaprenyl-phosphate alpha-N-acetylglucosaminyl 1-phosphate transferase [Treponema rectale]|uniref:UDP-GlcNAc:undecaprenyl-phosphate GlcNAc-1-phosphate transferase n=1 Tax=Treponema rectale TaxID=744512 RepID=A0A840S6S3_9SPIR|nr:MraY family glycosyltransferase [Treponema rectale]MBB5218259.1 UDP-GlcNAc:undecaprenyl-phosphate GlcNAc-1-phosphate transferase [Treponema rectale]QOS40038.1 undecaprenyl/decaprenyl-phosphate alpha-N-acetylglucosaminyl 1-phosphate transferase [Treponema rectale]
MLFCIAGAFLFNVFLTPLIIHFCTRFGFYDSMNPRKMHNGKVSRLGGIGIMVSSTAAFCVYVIFFSSRDYSSLMPVFISGLIVFFAGAVDDFFNLPAKIKFLFQIIAAAVVAAGPLYFKEFFIFDVSEITGRLMTFVWIISLVNSYNLIDGLDLLCSGLSFLTQLTLGILLIFCSEECAVLCFIFAAATFAFMLFNRPPARIFLGDSGSQFLGYSIAVIPLIYDFASFEDVKAAVMAVLVSIPVIDVFAAIWRRTREHRSIFSADRAHIHHKLINIGFSKTTSVLILLMIQFVISVSVLSLLLMKTFTQRFTVLAMEMMFICLVFIILHFVNRTVNRRLHGHLSEEPQE